MTYRLPSTKKGQVYELMVEYEDIAYDDDMKLQIAPRQTTRAGVIKSIQDDYFGFMD